MSCLTCQRKYSVGVLCRQGASIVSLVAMTLAPFLLSHAFAHKRNFVWQYGAATAFRGEREWKPHLSYVQRLSHSLWLGLEAFGNFHDHRYWFGPTVVLDAHYRTRLLLGVAFGLNRKSDTQLRFISGFEF